MEEFNLADQLLRDNVLAARALVALQLNSMHPEIHGRVNQAIANGAGHLECVRESAQAKLNSYSCRLRVASRCG